MLQEILNVLSPHYDNGEARAIAFLVLEEAFGISRTDIYAHKVRKFSEEEHDRWQYILSQLSNGVPVQYALGTARFFGRDFMVTPATLIPRPETEELVAWAVDVAQCDFPEGSLHVLDVGTGSGCIAVSLALSLPSSTVSAWEISPEALAVAQQNAQRHGAEVQFSQCDMCTTLPQPHSLQLIVSNPPYVCESEQRDMAVHVLHHEPHTALFVPDSDPLCFYRALGRIARVALCPGGSLLVEANCAYAHDTAALMEAMGLVDVSIRNDAFDRPRMVRGVQPHEAQHEPGV